MDSCVVSWFPLMGNIDSDSATMFFLPWIYSISGPYSSNMILHHNTLSILNNLQVRFYDRYSILIVDLITRFEITSEFQQSLDVIFLLLYASF